jgi:DNA polymerase III alpha subunit (gram-positive type)
VTDRQLVLIDLETSGLSSRTDFAVEAGWRNLATGESSTFVPVHPVDVVLKFGDPAALEINGYRKRLMRADQDHNLFGTKRLHRELEGNTIVGANPAFDARFMDALFYRSGLSPVDPQHHRMIDIEVYAMAVFDLKYVPGMSEICHRLDLPPGDHTAFGDVVAETRAFHELRRRAADRAALRRAS